MVQTLWWQGCRGAAGLLELSLCPHAWKVGFCLNLPHLAVPVYGAFCSVNVTIFSKNIATDILFDIVHTNSAHINGGLWVFLQEGVSLHAFSYSWEWFCWWRAGDISLHSTQFLCSANKWIRKSQMPCEIRFGWSFLFWVILCLVLESKVLTYSCVCCSIFLLRRYRIWQPEKLDMLLYNNLLFPGLEPQAENPHFGYVFLT